VTADNPVGEAMNEMAWPVASACFGVLALCPRVRVSVASSLVCFLPLKVNTHTRHHHNPPSPPVCEPILTFTNSQTDDMFYSFCPLPALPLSPIENHSGRLGPTMYLFFIRLRAKKLAKRADHQISQTRHLLDARGAEMERGDRQIIQERLQG
jgi:hypothetical protein